MWYIRLSMLRPSALFSMQLHAAGKRDAAVFLQNLGLQSKGKVVQRIVARHGNNTKDDMMKDPYDAMRNIKGMDLR